MVWRVITAQTALAMALVVVKKTAGILVTTKQDL